MLSVAIDDSSVSAFNVISPSFENFPLFNFKQILALISPTQQWA